MSAVILAVLLSVASAIGYAFGAVVQERVAARSGRGSVLTAPLWWLSIALNGAGAALHVVALGYGSLALVQPLGALTLVFALPAGSVLAGRRVTAREWRGAVTTLGGLGLLLLAVSTPAPGAALDRQAGCAVAALTALLLALLLRGGDIGAYRGLRLAAAGGVAFAVASVFSQTVILRLADPAADTVVTAVIAMAVAGLSVAGLMLTQSAYRFGLGAQLATVTIVNPVFAAAVGVLVLGQSVPAVGAIVAVPAALLAAGGVVLLATSDPAAVTAPARTAPTPSTPGDATARTPVTWQDRRRVSSPAVRPAARVPGPDRTVAAASPQHPRRRRAARLPEPPRRVPLRALRADDPRRHSRPSGHPVRENRAHR